MWARVRNKFSSRVPEGATQAVRLVDAFRHDGMAVSAVERARDVLVATEAATEILYTGGWTERSDSGFRRDFRDPHPSSRNQVGHFLTAVRFSLEPDLTENPVSRSLLGQDIIGHDTDFVERLAIGHELAPDPRFGNLIDGFENQFQAATDEHVRAFRRAVSRMSDDPNAHVDLESLREDLQPFIADIDSSLRGNSVQDLLLTAVGWRFGEMLRERRFENSEQASNWLERSLMEPGAPNTRDGGEAGQGGEQEED